LNSRSSDLKYGIIIFFFSFWFGYGYFDSPIVLAVLSATLAYLFNFIMNKQQERVYTFEIQMDDETLQNRLCQVASDRGNPLEFDPGFGGRGGRALKMDTPFVIVSVDKDKLSILFMNRGEVSTRNLTMVAGMLHPITGIDLSVDSSSTISGGEGSGQVAPGIEGGKDLFEGRGRFSDDFGLLLPDGWVYTKGHPFTKVIASLLAILISGFILDRFLTGNLSTGEVTPAILIGLFLLTLVFSIQKSFGQFVVSMKDEYTPPSDKMKMLFDQNGIRYTYHHRNHWGRELDRQFKIDRPKLLIKDMEDSISIFFRKKGEITQENLTWLDVIISPIKRT